MTPLQEASQEFARSEARTIDGAIRAWASQCGVSPEEWLKTYGIEVRRRVEGLKLISEVTATTRAGTINYRPFIMIDEVCS